MKIKNGGWLPDMDLNHDKQIQSLLCYRYTIGQTCVLKVEGSGAESRLVEASERQSVRALKLGSAGSDAPRSHALTLITK